jgi:hypothetical protein
MSSPPVRSGTVASGALLAAIALFALPVAAQRPPEFAPTFGLSLWFDAVAGGLLTLLIGGGLIALAPEFTDRTTDRVHEDPGEAFLYGLGIFLAALVVAVLLAITIVGLVLVVPLVVALFVVGHIGYLAVGRAVVDDWGPALLVAAVLSAVASGVPVLGFLVGFVLSSMGTGAWYLDYRDDGGGAGRSPDGDPVSGERAGSAADAGGGSRDAGTGGREQSGSAAGRSGSTVDGDQAADPGDAWTAGFDDDPDGE